MNIQYICWNEAQAFYFTGMRKINNLEKGKSKTSIRHIQMTDKLIQEIAKDLFLLVMKYPHLEMRYRTGCK